MAREYETQVLRPADGRVPSLPRPAVNLAQRLAQLAHERRDGVVSARVVIANGVWHMTVDEGKSERLGDGDDLG